MFAIRFSCRCAALLCCLAILRPAAAADEVAIRGRVRNADGKTIPYPHVSVRDAAGAVVKAEVQFDEEGTNFTLRVPTKLGKVSVLFENRPFHHPHLVTNLSTAAGDDHTITPVLRRSTGPGTYDLIVEQIMIYDGLLFSEFGAKPTRKTVDDYKARYEGLIRQIPDPARRETYPEGTLQRKALEGMTEPQRTLVSHKLRQLEGNLRSLVQATITAEFAPALPAPAP